MPLLDLPVENIVQILRELVTDIGVSQAWDLRTTCRKQNGQRP